MATFPSKVNYATGDILTATNMNDVGGAINLLDGAQYAAAKNVIINGNLDIWQRGTTFTSVVGQYTADRFQGNVAATSSNCTVTQDTSVPNANSKYSIKMQQVTSTATSVTEYGFRLWLEQQNIYQLLGRSNTISFWYKSNKTGTHALRIYGSYNTGGTDQLTSFTVSAADTWEKKTVTVTAFSAVSAASATATSAGGFVDIGFRNTSFGFTTLAANDYFQISQMQLEPTYTASPFARTGGTVAGELAACQRYLPAFSGSSLGGNLFNIMGFAYSTTNAQFNIPLPVTPRVRPTGITISALSDFAVFNQGFSSAAPTAITFNSGGNILQVNTTTTAGSPTLVLGQTCSLALSGANGLFLVTGCEL